MTDRSRPTQRLAAATLAGAIATWEHMPGPKYERLASAITVAIEDGEVSRGVGLPAERALATQLGVARGTVVAAYQQMVEHGVVERRRGSGTWVLGPTAADDPPPEFEAALRSRQLSGRFLGETGDVIDLAVSVIHDADGITDSALRIRRDRLAALSSGHGYHALGLSALRERIAELYSDGGLATTADQIAVTVGGQQAIALVAEALVDPGDHVVLERATFPGAIDAFARVGARFVTVPTDSAGVQVDAVWRAVARTSPRVVCVIPTCHNPTGTTMPARRRRELAAVASSDTWVVEDESLAWLHFDSSQPPSPVASYAANDRVVTIGSLSKLVWGGLRVGWIRADPALITRIARLKAAVDLGNCAISQTVALDLIDDLPAMATRRRARLRRSAALLGDLLTERIPDWSFRPPDGGLSLWVRLPGVSGEDFAAVAARHGVAVLPGNAASPRSEASDRIRISFAESDERIAIGVDRLCQAWSDVGHAVPAR